MSRKTEDTAFLRGVLAALHILDFCDPSESVTYGEICRANGPKALWDAAEEIDREHLRRHGYRPETGFDPRADYLAEPAQRPAKPQD